MSGDYVHYIVPRDRALCPTGAVVAALVESLRRDRWVPSEQHAALWEEPPRPPTAKFAVPTPPAPSLDDPAVFVVDPSRPPRRNRARPREEPVPSPLDAAFLESHATRRPGSAAESDYLLWFPVWPPDVQGPFAEVALRYPFVDCEDDTALHSHAIEVVVAGDLVLPFTNTFGDTSASCACGTELLYDADFPDVWSPIDGLSWRIHRTCPSCSAPAHPATFATEILDPWTRAPSLVPGSVASRFALRINCDVHFPAGPFRLCRDLADLVAAAIGQPVDDFGGIV